MTRLFLILQAALLVVSPLVARADGLPTLADNMKQIGLNYKAIGAAVNDPSQNAASAQAAGKLMVLFTAVQGQVPDTISKLPSNEQEAALADFKRLIQVEIAAATTLKKDFETGNNADAVAALSTMSSTKKEGHMKYQD